MKNKIERSSTGITREKRQIARTGKGIDKTPRIETIFDDDMDPLENVEYDVDNLEASAEVEMSEIVKQIKEQRKASRWNNSEPPVILNFTYWFAFSLTIRKMSF